MIERRGSHPVALQLKELEGAGRVVTVPIIVKLLVRHHTSEEDCPVEKFHNPSEAEKFLRELNGKIRDARKGRTTPEKSLLRERRAAAQAVREEKRRHRQEVNDARFRRDKFAVYNQVMNPLSEQECEVSKEEVEKRLKEKFGTDRPSVDPVPEFLPKVTSKMNDLHVNAQDLRNALKGKKGKASPGEDKVNYAMLREAMACEELAKPGSVRRRRNPTGMGGY